MYRLLSWVLAGGVVLGCAAGADAQVAVSVGNPFTGAGFSLGVPAVGYGYGYGSPYVGSPLVGTTYSSGYAGVVAPATGYFSTGYYGAYPLTSVYPSAYGLYGTGYGYGYAPYSYAPYRMGVGGWGRRWGRW